MRMDEKLRVTGPTKKSVGTDDTVTNMPTPSTVHTKAHPKANRHFPETLTLRMTSRSGRLLKEFSHPFLLQIDAPTTAATNSGTVTPAASGTAIVLGTAARRRRRLV
jgi:hypothetical protein